jgi:ribosomal protein S19
MAGFLHLETAAILGWVVALHHGGSFCALEVMSTISGHLLLGEFSWIQQPKMSPVVVSPPPA